jgi:hypothetical protein
VIGELVVRVEGGQREDHAPHVSEPLPERAALLSALTTEHFTLESARSSMISESLGRTTIYLGTLSATLVALALVIQGETTEDDVRLFALILWDRLDRWRARDCSRLRFALSDRMDSVQQGDRAPRSAVPLRTPPVLSLTFCRASARSPGRRGSRRDRCRGAPQFHDSGIVEACASGFPSLRMLNSSGDRPASNPLLHRVQPRGRRVHRDRREVGYWSDGLGSLVPFCPELRVRARQSCFRLVVTNSASRRQ